jgi:SAM-dependent methyltransferase
MSADPTRATNGSKDAAVDPYERVRVVFDDWAERGRAEGMEAGHAYSARLGFDRLELAEGQHYLDIGCGNGYTVRWAAELVGAEGQAEGVDLAPNMIERAQARSTALSNVLFQVAAYPHHTLPRRAFDGIFSMEVFYYLPDVHGALAETCSLLRPGGHFACLVDFYEENPARHSWPEELGCDMTRLSMAGWQAAFERAGLEVVEQTCIQYPVVPGEEPGWKQTQGTLLTLGRRPAPNRPPAGLTSGDGSKSSG